MNTLTQEEKNIFLRCNYLFLVSGIIAVSLGSLLPYVRDTHGLDYAFAGMLLSFHSIGNLISSFLGGIVPVYLGRKRSSMLFFSFGVIAFLLIAFSSNAPLIGIAFFLTGISRGNNSNFSNAIINEIVPGKAWALNLLHSCFSIGAFLIPFFIMLLTRNESHRWIYASVTIAALCLIQVVVVYFMKIPNNFPAAKERNKHTFSFLKNKSFIILTCILFFYLSAEQGINGWLVTYFKETGIMSAAFAQAMSGILWLVILLGRLLNVYLSQKVKKSNMLLISSGAYFIFFILLLMAQTPPLAILGIIGVGFSMAGLYPTIIASAGLVIKKEPFALSFLITIAGLGAIIMPTIMGIVADNIGIAGGMGTLVITVSITLIFICYNAFINRKNEEL